MSARLAANFQNLLWATGPNWSAPARVTVPQLDSTRQVRLLWTTMGSANSDTNSFEYLAGSPLASERSTSASPRRRAAAWSSRPTLSTFGGPSGSSVSSTKIPSAVEPEPRTCFTTNRSAILPSIIGAAASICGLDARVSSWPAAESHFSTNTRTGVSPGVALVGRKLLIRSETTGAVAVLTRSRRCWSNSLVTAVTSRPRSRSRRSSRSDRSEAGSAPVRT